MTIARSCQVCGAAFSVFPSVARKPGKARFCSRRCGNAALAARKTRPLADRLWSRVEKSEGCWLWTGSLDRRGYGRIGVGTGRIDGAHRVAYRLTYGEVPKGVFVLHSCDTPACCRPDHLRLGSHQDNTDDMTARERQARGSRHGSARLTAPQVVEIRRRYSAGERSKDLAAEFGVAGPTVCDLVKRRTWGWLD